MSNARGKYFRELQKSDESRKAYPSRTTLWRKRRTFAAESEDTALSPLLSPRDMDETHDVAVVIDANEDINADINNCEVESEHQNDTNDSQDNGNSAEPWYDTEDDWWDAEEELTADAAARIDLPQSGSYPTENFEDSGNSDADEPLYKGSPITLGTSMLLILTFAFQCNLTASSITRLLTLIALHCPVPNICKTSKHLFRKFFGGANFPLKRHRICSVCENLLSKETKCSICGANEKQVSHFIEIPLDNQLKELYRRDEFVNDLQHRYTRQKQSSENVEDIYDGNLYKQQRGFLKDPNHLSLMWYTDGVGLFKSSNASIWPLTFIINELPYYKRMKLENMLFCGLWFGDGKPSMTSFLKPFYQSMENLWRDGVQVTLPNGLVKTIKAMLLCGTCDLPARTMVMNMIQFNGKFGCIKCVQTGKSVSTGKGHTFVFPFDEANIDGPKRDHNTFLDNARMAFTAQAPQQGIKGLSWFSNLMPDVIQGVGIDYMHGVLLGIIRRLLALWFDPKFSKEPFSATKRVGVADERLLQVKPPNFLTRIPRSIKLHASHWKASECRNWLFYYSVPVLYGLLNEQIYQHYLLLVEAIYILNLESITPDNLDHCERVLRHFICMFEVLYGERYMSANFHQLLHLVDNVRSLGPLWVTSCFPLEDVMGKLTKLFHGTQHPQKQIINAVCTLKRMPFLVKTLEKDTPTSLFYDSMTTGKTHAIREQILDQIYTLGAMKHETLNVDYQHAVSDALGW